MPPPEDEANEANEPEDGMTEPGAISAEMVKRLREITGAGMMDCKKALQEADGDLDKAQEILRQRGLASFGKRAGRQASEGLVDAYIHGDAPRQLLIALTDALIRVGEQPTLDVLYRLFRLLSAEAVGIRRSYGTLFGARSFRDLGLLAAGFVRRERG